MERVRHCHFQLNLPSRVKPVDQEDFPTSLLLLQPSDPCPQHLLLEGGGEGVFENSAGELCSWRGNQAEMIASSYANRNVVLPA